VSGPVVVRSGTYVALLALAVSFLLVALPARGRDARAVTGSTPIMDLGLGTYLGFPGGLYENGSNSVPADHASAGAARAAAVQPLDTSGSPSPGGKIVLLSVGMSNTTQEFCSGNSALPCSSWSFMGQAAVDAFRGVDRNGQVWAHSLFDNAWGLHKDKEYGYALGNVLSTRAPFFESFYEPEANIREAIVYYRLCLFPQASATINGFFQRYSPYSAKIKSFRKQAEKRPPEQVFAFLKDFVDSPRGKAASFMPSDMRAMRPPTGGRHASKSSRVSWCRR